MYRSRAVPLRTALLFRVHARQSVFSCFFPYATFCARLSKSVEFFSFSFPFYPLLFLYLCYKM